jgi:ribosome-interacting GTPase 1
MPANLPPDYYAAEERFRAAKTNGEKIACLEEMLMVMPKHKGTDKLKADIRRRISKLKEQPQAKGKAGARSKGEFHVEREGAAQVMVVGTANTGKSSLVSAVTQARPQIADFPMTTWSPMPGMLDVDGVPIQLVDTPALDAEYLQPDLLDLLRRSDMIAVVVDVNTDPAGQLERCTALLEDNRIVPQHMRRRWAHANRVMSFLPFLVVANRCDHESAGESLEIFRELAGGEWPLVAVSASAGWNLDGFKCALINELQLIRVFSKLRGKPPDMTEPFVLKRGSTVEDFARKVHLDFVAGLKSAKVWGKGVFDGQMVHRDHTLQDGDVVELHV